MILYTDAELARLLLSRLLWAHDRAGVSAGRSPRNVLAALAGTLLPEVATDDADTLNVGNMVAEAARRVPRKFYQQELFRGDLDLVSNERLATSLLHKLRDWYAQDEARNGEPLGMEQEILTSVIRLLCPWPDEQLSNFSTVSLVNEAERRNNVMLSQDTLW